MRRNTSRPRRPVQRNVLLLANADESQAMRARLAELVARQLSQANKYHLKLAEAYRDMAEEKTEEGVVGNFYINDLLMKAQYHLGAALGVIQSMKQLAALFTRPDETYSDTFMSMTDRAARVLADVQTISAHISDRPFAY